MTGSQQRRNQQGPGSPALRSIHNPGTASDTWSGEQGGVAVTRKIEQGTDSGREGATSLQQGRASHPMSTS